MHSISTNTSAALKTWHAFVRCFFAYNETDRFLKIAPSGLKYSASVADIQGHWVRRVLHRTRGTGVQSFVLERDSGCVSAWQTSKAVLHYPFFSCRWETVASFQWDSLNAISKKALNIKSRDGNSWPMQNHKGCSCCIKQSKYIYYMKCQWVPPSMDASSKNFISS